MSFYLLDTDIAGTQVNVRYQCSQSHPDGIYATGLRVFEEGTLNNPFWVPNFTDIQLAD
ncbi:hypothetical protein V2H45_05875 [Tumidithrix elongata RA019]|uniref:Uncharacterized protein n=2 Tax=Tumidithrix TaxID=3088355 RepID=A0AAW9PWR1_9CYAN|nr:hypothetical protein [Tumidithrix elongata RA019]